VFTKAKYYYLSHGNTNLAPAYRYLVLIALCNISHGSEWRE